MTCIIIDDDRVAQKAMQLLISEVSGLTLIGSFDTAMSALEPLRRQEVDLVFLDIEMPGMSGLDLLRNIPDLPQIIVCSSRRDYAVDAFEFSVTDYLVKPLTRPRFAKAMEKAWKVQADRNPKSAKSGSFFVKHKGYYISLRPEDVLYFEALSDYVNIYTGTGKHTIYSTMKAVEARLPAADFFRIHRSYIIRLDKITVIEENCVFLNDTCLPVGKSYMKEFTKRLNFL